MYSKELIELTFHQPYCKTSFLVDIRYIAKRHPASLYLQELDSAGCLKSESAGRERVYMNCSLLDVLKG